MMYYKVVCILPNGEFLAEAFLFGGGKRIGENAFFCIGRIQQFLPFGREKGGIALDGPYMTRFNDTQVPAQACRKCRKIVLDYGT